MARLAAYSGCSPHPIVAEPAKAQHMEGLLFGNKLKLVLVPVSAYIYLFYNHEHPNKLHSNTYSIVYVSKVIFAPLAGLEMRVSQIFLMFNPNYIFVSCSDVTYTRHVKLVGDCESRNLTLGCTICYIYVKELSAYNGGAWEVFGLRVVLLSPCFRGGVAGVKYCWNRFSTNFSFRNKPIIVFPFGLLVDSNTFLKCLTGYTADGNKNENAYVLIIIIITKAMKSLCWLF